MLTLEQKRVLGAQQHLISTALGMFTKKSPGAKKNVQISQLLREYPYLGQKVECPECGKHITDYTKANDVAFCGMCESCAISNKDVDVDTDYATYLKGRGL